MTKTHPYIKSIGFAPVQTHSIYRGFKIEPQRLDNGDVRFAVSRPQPFAVYRTYDSDESARSAIDRLCATTRPAFGETGA